jgi:hypothetical protein
MTAYDSVLCFQSARPGFWSTDWAWGLPLIVLTVVIHVLGLGFMNMKALQVLNRAKEAHHNGFSVFTLVMGTVTLLASILHGAEAGIWALSYEFLGARSDYKSAMLYSMGSIKRDVKKKAPPRREDRRYFSRSSPLCFVTSEDARLVIHSRTFFFCCWQSSGAQDAASRTMSTMVLSEARGLSLFLVIRGGIA